MIVSFRGLFNTSNLHGTAVPRYCNNAKFQRYFDTSRQISYTSILRSYRAVLLQLRYMPISSFAVILIQPQCAGQIDSIQT